MEPIHFDRYEQFAERMDENQLIEYIMSEFNNFHAERMNDVSGGRLNALALLCIFAVVTSANWKQGAATCFPCRSRC